MRGSMQALGALREMVAEARDDSSNVGPHSLHIGATNTLAAEVKYRRGRSGETVDGRFQHRSSTYVRNNLEDAGIVSRKLAETGNIGQRHPGQGTVWGLRLLLMQSETRIEEAGLRSVFFRLD